MMQHSDSSKLSPKAEAQPEEQQETIQDARRDEVVALFRFLMKEPPQDHDFRTCPTCKRYGITGI